MTGYIDLHCHYLPNVDDGVRTTAAGIELCQGLASLGYSTLVATPHIRPFMYDNRRAGLQPVYDAFQQALGERTSSLSLGLAAEHYFDEQFSRLVDTDQAMPYPGGKAMLVELNANVMPLGVEERFFSLNVRGIRPVLAHPERYSFFFRDSAWLYRLRELGTLLQLDLMSLAGVYGRMPQRLAERWLAEGIYSLACSDCHRPEQVSEVANGIERLVKRCSSSQADGLLREGPQKVLDGTATPY